MTRNINLQNIEDALSSLTYPIKNQNFTIEAIFELETFEISKKTDDLNFQGNVCYILDTEYGGGPVSVKVDFSVQAGKLFLDLAALDYEKLLNWKEIESESNLNYALIEDEEDEETDQLLSDDVDDFEYFYEEEN